MNWITKIFRGAITFLNTSTTGQDTIKINPNSADVDVYVYGSSATALLQTDAAANTMTISNAIISANSLSVAGNTLVDSKLETAGTLCLSGVQEVTIGRVETGANLIVNGTFDADTDWTKSFGATIHDGRAYTDGEFRTVGQDIVTGITIGHSYRVTVDADVNTGGTLRMFESIDNVVLNITVSGTYSMDILNASMAELHLNFACVNNDPGGSWDNVVVKELVIDTPAVAPTKSVMRVIAGESTPVNELTLDGDTLIEGTKVIIENKYMTGFTSEIGRILNVVCANSRTLQISSGCFGEVIKSDDGWMPGIATLHVDA